MKVIRKEGILALYNGLTSGIAGVGVSSFTYFWFYYYLKKIIIRQNVRIDSTKRFLTPLQNILIAALAGAINAVITNPLWVVNTRMSVQSKGTAGHIKETDKKLTDEKKNNTETGTNSSDVAKNRTSPYIYESSWHCARRIVEEEGVGGLFKGIVPSLILVSNPAIQFVVYEQLTRYFLAQKKAALVVAFAGAAVASVTKGTLPFSSVASSAAYTSTSASAQAATPPSDATAAEADRTDIDEEEPITLSGGQYFLIGAVAKAIATVATYPYQVVKSREQANSSANAPTTWQIVTNIYAKEGLSAFRQGLNTKLSQTVSNAAFMFLFYEEIYIFLKRLVVFYLRQHRKRLIR